MRYTNHDIHSISGTTMSSAISSLSGNTLTEIGSVDDETEISQEELTSMQFGRAPTVKMLNDIYKRVQHACSRVVLVCGSSGTGKTSLLETLRGPVTEDGNVFVRVKFDQFVGTAPFSTLFTVISDICSIAMQNKSSSSSVRRRLKQIFDKDCIMLASFVANLALILGEEHVHPYRSNVLQDFQRFKNEFKLIIKAFSFVTLVIWFDDIQWADSESLLVVRSMASDVESTNMLLLLSYRKNEPSTLAVEEALSFESEHPHISQSFIELQDLNHTSFTEMVACLLQLPPSKTLMLSHILHYRTNGNPFFLTMLLKSLIESGKLYRNDQDRSWMWDSDEIQNEVEKVDDVKSLLDQMLCRLPQELQDYLVTAAMMGSTFRHGILIDFILQWKADIEGETKWTRQRLNSVLTSSIYDNFLDKDDSGFSRFLYSQIQQRLLESPSFTNLRNEIYGRLGWFLYSLVNQYSEEVLFAAADCFHLGISDIKESDIVKVAEIHLTAGAMAKKRSAFRFSAMYAQYGLILLKNPLPWKLNYDLVFSLSILLAESKLCLGDFAAAISLIKEIIMHANQNLHKLMAQKLLVEISITTFEVREVIQRCFETLKEHDTSFPKNSKRIQISTMFSKTKKAVSSLQDNDFLKLPKMQDDYFSRLIEIHDLLQIYAIIDDQYDIFVYSSLRCLEMSLQFGYSFLTASAVATYGLLHVRNNNINLGIRFATLAMDLQNSWLFSQGYCRTLTISQCYCLHLTQKVNMFMSSLHGAIFHGITCGDSRECLQVAGFYAFAAFVSGASLPDLVEEITTWDEQFADFTGDSSCCSVYKIVLTTAMNLMNLTDESDELTSLVMNEESAFNFASNDSWMRVRLYTFKAFLLFHFGNASRAYEYAIRIVNEDVSRDKCLDFYFTRLYCGMIFLQLANETGKRKFVRLARRKVIDKLRKVADSPNAKPVIKLLEAEYLACCGKSSEIFAPLFMMATQLARNDQNLHYEALALERTSRAFSRKGEIAKSVDHLNQAINAYRNWNANAKVDYMEELRQSQQTTRRSILRKALRNRNITI
jgi:predicted ATPase